jgi:hypothetical protein
MILHGVLHILNGESRLDDNTLLANCASSSPLVAGTAFLQNRGCANGEFIVVTGTPSTIGNVAVFCMDDAKPVGTSVPNMLTVIPKTPSTPGAALQNASPAASPKRAPAKPKATKQPARKGAGKRV